MTDEKASKRGRNNRAKGGKFEREVAEALRSIFPNAKRTIGQARTGAEAPDVQGTPFWVECGLGATVRAEKKLAQAEHDWLACDDDHGAMFPAAFTRKPHGETMVSMRLGDWLHLVKKAYEP